MVCVYVVSAQRGVWVCVQGKCVPRVFIFDFVSARWVCALGVGCSYSSPSSVLSHLSLKVCLLGLYGDLHGNRARERGLFKVSGFLHLVTDQALGEKETILPASSLDINLNNSQILEGQ